MGSCLRWRLDISLRWKLDSCLRWRLDSCLRLTLGGCLKWRLVIFEMESRQVFDIGVAQLFKMEDGKFFLNRNGTVV